MANKNSVLLFGDYGTEVIRLSQLYDPDKCLYRPVGAGDLIESGKTYYSPELRNKTVFFDTVDLSSRVGEHFTQDGEYYTLQGVRVANPTKGVYILNGKKVIIK